MKRFILPLAAFALTLVGCQSDNVDEPIIDSQESTETLFVERQVVISGTSDEFTRSTVADNADSFTYEWDDTHNFYLSISGATFGDDSANYTPATVEAVEGGATLSSTLSLNPEITTFESGTTITSLGPIAAESGEESGAGLTVNDDNSFKAELPATFTDATELYTNCLYVMGTNTLTEDVAFEDLSDVIGVEHTVIPAILKFKHSVASGTAITVTLTASDDIFPTVATLSAGDINIEYSDYTDTITVEGTLDDDQTLYALIFPTTLGDETIEITATVGGVVYEINTLSSTKLTAFESSNAYVMNIDIDSATRLIAVGDYLYSDLTYSSTLDADKTLLGVVTSVNDDYKTGTVININSESKAWASSSSAYAYKNYLGTNLDYATVGLGIQNMKTVYVANSNSFTDMPAFAYVEALNSDVDYRTIGEDATGVWYFPCEGDVRSIITATVMADDSVINSRIEAAGGVTMVIGGSTGYYFNTSTEVDAGTNYYKHRTVYYNANSTTMVLGGISKTNAGPWVRPMMNFDLDGFSNGTESVLVTSIAITTAEQTIYTGETLDFEATVSSGATNAELTWVSSNTDVATFSGSTLTAVAAGTTDITAVATDGSLIESSSVTITVEKIEVEGVEIGDYLYKTATGYEYSPTYDSTKTLLGVVYFVDEDDSSAGKVLNINEGSGIAWSTSTYSSINVATTYASYTYTWGTYSLGAAGYGMDAMILVYNNLDSKFSEFPAFEWIAKLNSEDGESVAGDYSEYKTGLWYMPGEYDVKYELFTACYDNAIIGTQITAANGDVVPMSTTYMVSSEAGASTNSNYRTNSYSDDNGAIKISSNSAGKTTTSHYIRAVMDFTGATAVEE